MLNAFAEFTGTQLHPQQAGMVGQVFNQFFPQKTSQNHLIIQMLSECAAALDAGIRDTYCTAAFTPCLKQLQKNAKALGKEVPSWVGRQPTGKQEL